jgi:multidrug efflux pump subunit AcrA (membrane-fusion protein)
VRIYETLTTNRVEIRAHSNGIISRVNFVAGQIVQPQTTLFEIVDPTRLWIEAASFDPALATDIAGASAVTADGRVLQLHFTGGGLMLQNQAVPLQFDILGDVADLQVGRPVTVIVQRRHSESAGIRLPRAAVLHDTTGETIVWERLSAEDFIARQVNTAPLDGNDVVVTSGLTANMRIVTAAAEALTQVR